MVQCTKKSNDYIIKKKIFPITFHEHRPAFQKGGMLHDGLYREPFPQVSAITARHKKISGSLPSLIGLILEEYFG